MSAKRLLIFGSILIAAAVALIMVVLSGPAVDRSARPSTYSSGEMGCKGLYLALEELQLPVARLRTDFTRLKDREGVLVVVYPLLSMVRPRERERLKEWIEKGNRLVLFQSSGVLPELETAMKIDGDRRTARKIRRAGDLAALFGLKARKIGKDSRNSAAVTLPGVPEAGPISVARSIRWKGPPEGWTTIARDEDGPIVVEGHIGRGTVVAVADSTFVSNEYLPLERNMKLVVGLLLARGLPIAIMFDEYHQGHAIAESFWKYVGSSVFMWLMVQCFAGLVLVLYSRRASHAGRYRSMAVDGGRSTLEHVDSLAGIFESCKASSAALAAIVERFIGRYSRVTGVRPPSIEGAAFKSAIAGLRTDQSNVANLLEDCRAAILGPDDPQKSLVLAQKLAKEAALMRKRGSTRA